MSVYQLSAAELYEAYRNHRSPQELVGEGRTQIATRLMVDEQLDQEAAYFAADRIMEYAQKIVDGTPRKH